MGERVPARRRRSPEGRISTRKNRTSVKKTTAQRHDRRSFFFLLSIRDSCMYIFFSICSSFSSSFSFSVCFPFLFSLFHSYKFKKPLFNSAIILFSFYSVPNPISLFLSIPFRNRTARSTFFLLLFLQSRSPSGKCHDAVTDQKK